MARTTRVPGSSVDPGSGPVPQAVVDDPPPVIARGTREDVSDEALRARAAQDGIASVVHDLKSPLAIISLEAELLARRLASHLDPTIQRGLDRIHHNAQYLDRLVSELLDLAALEAGHLALHKRTVDLSRLVVDTVDRAVSTIDRARIMTEGPARVCVLADPSRLERVISNLISNALKYSDASVLVRLDVISGRACVSVIDTGPGLSEQQARTVFDRYDRAGEAHHQDGHGLGLFVSKRIMDAHGGALGVESTVGRGARFFFELPAVPSPDNAPT